MIELISENEKAFIDACRHEYLYKRDYEWIDESKWLSVENFLKPWERAKSPFLHKLFNGNLILEKEFKYTLGEDELQYLIEEKLFAPEEFFLRNLEKKIKEEFKNELDEGPWLYSAWDLIYAIHSTQNIAQNKIYSNLEIKDIDGNLKIKITSGTKMNKVFKMLAERYDMLDEYEKFRIKHSQILNQKKVTGTLCLSIHPLDYITMSDNDCKWSSCMSWRKNGEFRQGTIEMMNSPCVVVAYLKSDKKDYAPFEDSSLSWNNKKWRCLFIVDGESRIISSVKAYPYYNEELIEGCGQWLTEMMHEKFGTEYELMKSDYEDEDSYIHFKINGENHWACFETEIMYNDFGTTDHFMYIPKDFHSSKENIRIEYSGAPMSVISGVDTNPSSNPSYYEDAQLLYNRERDLKKETCAICGSEVYSYTKDYVSDNDVTAVPICDMCKWKYLKTDDIDGELFYINYKGVEVDFMASVADYTTVRYRFFFNDMHKQFAIWAFGEPSDRDVIVVNANSDINATAIKNELYSSNFAYPSIMIAEQKLRKLYEEMTEKNPD